MTLNYFDINNYNIHQSSPQDWLKSLPPTFSMEHLLQGFSGVDARGCVSCLIVIDQHIALRWLAVSRRSERWEQNEATCGRLVNSPATFLCMKLP